jgi:acetyl-CoA synthetase
MVINNHQAPSLSEPLVPGSMGTPMPGFSACVLVHNEDVEAPDGETGRLAIDVPASPLFWFHGYFRDDRRTAERFARGGRYFLTGDAARRDGDGRFFFSGRADDVMLTAGYRIGPFEVESVLVEHPDVAEAAVVGKPDPIRGEAIHAFVVLRPGREPSETLATDLQTLVRERLARHAYPREVHVVDELPKTPSGKIQRYLLRQR